MFHDLLQIWVLSLVGNLFVKKTLQDFLSSLNAVISTNDRNWILKGHVIFKLNQIYQLKTTMLTLCQL